MRAIAWRVPRRDTRGGPGIRIAALCAYWDVGEVIRLGSANTSHFPRICLEQELRKPAITSICCLAAGLSLSYHNYGPPGSIDSRRKASLPCKSSGLFRSHD